MVHIGFKIKVLALVAAAALMASAAGAAAGAAAPAATEDTGSEFGVITPKVRVEAPAFTLTDVEGEERSLEEFRGKLVLLNFWGTWCAPCRREMPALEKLWKEFGESGLVVVGVAGDRGRKGMQKVKEFRDTHSLTFPLLLDSEGDARKDYEIMALPTSYLIGRDGKFLGKILGEKEWDGEEAKELIIELLNRAP
ncbi:MAG: TlpA disulfide reductase family protein [Thermodesulfobacteriota bacterium]